MAEVDPSPPTLDYGRPAYRGRGSWRWIAVGAITLGLGFIIGKAVSNAYSPQWTHWRGAVAIEASAPPPSTLIYSEEAADVARLRTMPLYKATTRVGLGVFTDVERQSLWINDPDQPGASMRSGETPIGRRRAGGPWRFISLTANADGVVLDSQFHPVSRRVDLPIYETCSIASPWPGTRFKQIKYGYTTIEIGLNDRVTMSAGALDPADESHLTFDYTINGQPGTVDGWLQPDDQMRFRIRSGPATTRPSKNYLPSASSAAAPATSP